jgi:SAM-dependent methyltransferase
VTSVREHWQNVYAAKTPEEVSWHQQTPRLSLELIARASGGSEASVIDIGGGASTLVDHLLKAGYRDITVLDIADAALDHARARLGADAARVNWIVADITARKPSRRFDIWHDRAALHFLTAPAAQHAYAEALRTALKPGGAAIIGGFAPGGRTKCSGLDVVQHDAESLSALLGEEFALIDAVDDLHMTPSGAEQPFRFHLFRRRVSA